MSRDTQQESSVIAVIPARGGSKGIKRKNLRPLWGKPLLAHSIEQARSTPSVARVFVSTDDPEIGAVARDYGSEVIWRPAEISGDTASSESALIHALDSLRETEQYEPKLVVFLQATSPRRGPDDVANAIRIVLAEEADSLLSVRPVEGFLWRSAGSHFGPVNYDPQRRPRRQELSETFWEENGSIYVFKPWILRAYSSRLGGKVSVLRMGPLDSFQVDEPSDLKLLERLGPHGGSSCLPHDPEELSRLLERIRLLVLDFDGVMTDNRVLADQDGGEAVWCHRGDGWGIARLKERGVEIIVISTEANPVVAARCRKLGIHCTHDCADKLTALRRLAEDKGLLPASIAYVGNDVNDLDCLRWVGLPIAVADAEPEVRAVAALVTTRPGGMGAVREVTDWFPAARTVNRDF